MSMITTHALCILREVNSNFVAVVDDFQKLLEKKMKDVDLRTLEA